VSSVSSVVNRLLEMNFTRVLACCAALAIAGAASGQPAKPMVSPSGEVDACAVPGKGWNDRILSAIDACGPASQTPTCIVNARCLTGRWTMTGDLTIPRGNVHIDAGDATIEMGLFGIVVPAGTSGVALWGVGPWGGTTDGGGSTGKTTFRYRGHDTAIAIGGATSNKYPADTVFDTDLRDLRLDLSAAAQSARGISLYLAINNNLDQIFLEGRTMYTDKPDTNTQVGLYIDWGGNYSGQTWIKNPYIIGFNKAIHVVGTCCTFLMGGAIRSNDPANNEAVFVDGGQISVFGTDIESAKTAYHLTKIATRFCAAGSRIVAGRIEGNTTDLQLDACSGHNSFDFTYWMPKVVDNTSLAPTGQQQNSVNCEFCGVPASSGDPRRPIQSRWYFDTPWVIQQRAGATTDQSLMWEYRGHENAKYFSWGVVGSKSPKAFVVCDSAAPGCNLEIANGEDVKISASGKGAPVRFGTANPDNGGVEFWGGGAKTAAVTSGGQATFNSGVRFSATGQTRTRFERYTVTFAPREVAAGSCVEQPLKLADLKADDVAIAVLKPGAEVGITIGAWRTIAAGSLGVTFCNSTGTPITPAKQPFTVVVIQ
jgi:hypothetical protein